MSDMECPICPICGGDLIKGEDFPWFYSCQSTNWKSDADKICELDDCAASVPVWETLQRTRKALGVAVDALKRLEKELYFNNAKQTGHIADSVMSIPSIALEQITALEQKDK